MKCIGVKIGKPGTYEGISYHNVYLHCMAPFDPGDSGRGQRVEQVKVPMHFFDRSGFSPDDLLDEDIYPSYDKYGRVMRIDRA